MAAAVVLAAAVVDAVIAADILKGFHVLLPSTSQLVIRAMPTVVAAVIAKVAVMIAAVVATRISSMSILMAAEIVATMMAAEIVPTMMTAAEIVAAVINAAKVVATSEATSESASANVAATADAVHLRPRSKNGRTSELLESPLSKRAPGGCIQLTRKSRK
jgi:hypothetical protein